MFWFLISNSFNPKIHSFTYIHSFSFTNWAQPISYITSFCPMHPIVTIPCQLHGYSTGAVTQGPVLRRALHLTWFKALLLLS